MATCLTLNEQVCEVSILPDASVCFKSMSGKCAAGGSVVLAVSFSSCSFLFIVNIVFITRALDFSHLDALQRLGTPAVILMPEQ